MLSTIRSQANISCFRRSFSSSISAKESLKVAFFGSDDFSVPSLKALSQLSRSNPELIDSIDVIAKHPKLTGRDLKTTTDVRIAKEAQDLGLQVIRAESNSEILSLIENKYHMAIAVSYGKLIPKKFIEELKYSINIHPSLLPKYSGASPIQYALLNQDEYTGVTLQTLHPSEFDKGQIIAQSDKISIDAGNTAEELRHSLGKVGAEMLKDVIVDGRYKTPQFESVYEYSYAKKVNASMKQIDWKVSTRKSILAQFSALDGALYSYKEIKVKQRRKPLIHDFRRVLFHELKESDVDLPSLEPGQFVLGEKGLLIKTLDGTLVSRKLQFEFQKKEVATDFVKHLEKRAGDTPDTFVHRV